MAKKVNDIILENIHWISEYGSFKVGEVVWASKGPQDIQGKILNIRFDKSISRPQFQIESDTRIFLATKLDKVTRVKPTVKQYPSLGDQLLLGKTKVRVWDTETNKDYVGIVTGSNNLRTEFYFRFLSENAPFQNSWAGIQHIKSTHRFKILNIYGLESES